jgi:hypothetical protein
MKIQICLSVLSLLLNSPLMADPTPTSQTTKVAISKAVDEKKNLGYFNKINLSGIGDLYIKQSAEESFTVEAEDTILPLIKVYVKDKVLFLDLKDASSHTQANIKYYLTIKDLQSIDSFSSSTIYLSEGFNGDTLNISLNSLGEANIKVNVKTLNVKIEGGGKLQARGVANELGLIIKGAGEFDGSQLQGKTGVLTIDGTSLAKTDVSDSLSITATGDAKIMYCGSPVITRQISGKGTVTALDDKYCKLN